MVQPAWRAAWRTLFELASMLFAAMQSFTASWSFPPGVVNSFWYSIKTKDVTDGSNWYGDMSRCVVGRGLFLWNGAKAAVNPQKIERRRVLIIIPVFYEYVSQSQLSDSLINFYVWRKISQSIERVLSYLACRFSPIDKTVDAYLLCSCDTRDTKARQEVRPHTSVWYGMVLQYHTIHALKWHGLYHTWKVLSYCAWM